MSVISVLNQKGGSGKSTISTHLARGIQLRNLNVLLVDSDPQGSARDWAAVREDQPVTVIGLDRPTLDRDIKKLNHNGIVIIDGAPQASDLAISAIKASDLIIIPVQPSPYDIWATADLVDLVKQRQEITEGKLKAFFVISRVIQGTKLGNEITEALKDYDLPILETKITQRIAYPTVTIEGKTVFDIKEQNSASQEMNNLIDEILKSSIE